MEKKQWSDSIRGWKTIFLALSVALTVGCATTARMYTGEALPKERIAVIGGSYNHRFLRTRVFTVTIVSVNEERLKNPVKGGSQRIQVIPGAHEILVDMEFIQCHYFGLWASCDNFFLIQQKLELNVQAGHEYKIQLENWWTPDGFIVVVDTNTGEVILRDPLGAVFL